MTTSGNRGEPLLNIVSYGRHGPGRVDRLSPAQVEQIARTVRRVPEVMVKVSGGGTSPKAVAAHLQYIDRHGKLDLELDDGELLQGKGSGENLADEWDLEAEAAETGSPYGGKPGRKAAKLAHNIVLSMPAGTPPDRLLAASRTFAREQFALKHRYAMVLHTDQDHPHVHLVVKAISEQGVRLNTKKAMLRYWRSQFASHLRELGVAANATERAVRGESQSARKDGIYRASLRGESSYLRAQAEAVARELSGGGVRGNPGKRRLLETRASIRVGWLDVADRLSAEGEHQLAAEVIEFTRRLVTPHKDRERLTQNLAAGSRASPKQIRTR